LKILTVVLARGGSKRLPGKNMRTLGSKPLLLWSIDVAKGISEIVDILVSTDDPAIAEAARNAGALVPWLRPAELATDTASSLDASIHALDWYEREKRVVDGIMLLQPTSPFRSRHSVLQGIDLFRAHACRPVVGVSPAESHPFWCFKVDDSGMQPYVEGADLHTRSQDLPPAYVINGAFYLTSPTRLRAARSFFADDMVPLVMDRPEESIDIDTELDWNAAQWWLARGLGEE
jgi:CMP-N,N'-diacetyllegionaminic acid synthase